MMDVGQPWYNKSIISDVWFTLILLHLLLGPGTGISHNSFKQPTYLPSLFSFIHTCGVCLTSKQSPQHFMQQRVPTPLWGAHLQLMALTDSRSARSTTLHSHFPLTSHLVTTVVRGVHSKQTTALTNQPIYNEASMNKTQRQHTQWNPHKTSTILYESTSAKQSAILFST